jgi:hypothetical protein
MTKRSKYGFSDPVEGPKIWFNLCIQTRESLRIFREIITGDRPDVRCSEHDNGVEPIVQHMEGLNKLYKIFLKVGAKRFTKDERKKADADILYYVDALIRRCDSLMSRYQSMEDLR